MRLKRSFEHDVSHCRFPFGCCGDTRIVYIGGVTHVDDGYTWVSQNTSFGLNVVLGPQLVGNKKNKK